MYKIPNSNLTHQSRVLESHNCHLIASYYRHFRLVVLESFSNFLTHLSHAGKKPVLTCHLAILKNTARWSLSGIFPPFFLLEVGLSARSEVMGRGEGGG